MYNATVIIILLWFGRDNKAINPSASGLGTNELENIARDRLKKYI